MQTSVISATPSPLRMQASFPSEEAERFRELLMGEGKPAGGTSESVSGGGTADDIKADKRRKLEATAEEFESVYLSFLLKQMRSTLSEGLFAGDKSDTFGGLFDQFMGQHLAESGGFGMASMVIRDGESRLNLLTPEEAAQVYAEQDKKAAAGSAEGSGPTGGTES